jgi:hypothetical protein
LKQPFSKLVKKYPSLSKLEGSLPLSQNPGSQMWQPIAEWQVSAEVRQQVTSQLQLKQQLIHALWVGGNYMLK